MFQTNSYFDGKVTSIAFQTETLPATVGVMAAGEYEFGTSQRETMTVITGALIIRLPGSTDWTRYNAGDSFVVEAQQKFGVKVEADSSYLCLYG